MEEALLKKEKEMIDEFNVAEGLAFQEWPPQKKKKNRTMEKKISKD